MSRLGPLITKSTLAEIYAWGDAHTLKLYRPGASAGAAAREAAHARIARDAGIPTPRVIEEITLDGRTGVVFERMDGPSMLEVLIRHPETSEDLARQFAALHADLHGRGISAVRASFCTAYLQHYTVLRSETIAELDAWHLPIAVARLAELVAATEQAAIVRFIDELMSHP